MEAVLKLKADEFSDELIQKIKLLLLPNSDYTITISISDDKNKLFFSKLDNAISSLQHNEGQHFTLETLEEFIKKN